MARFVPKRECCALERFIALLEFIECGACFHPKRECCALERAATPREALEVLKFPSQTGMLRP